MGVAVEVGSLTLLTVAVTYSVLLVVLVGVVVRRALLLRWLCRRVLPMLEVLEQEAPEVRVVMTPLGLAPLGQLEALLSFVFRVQPNTSPSPEVELAQQLMETIRTFQLVGRQVQSQMVLEVQEQLVVMVLRMLMVRRATGKQRGTQLLQLQGAAVVDTPSVMVAAVAMAKTKPVVVAVRSRAKQLLVTEPRPLELVAKVLPITAMAARQKTVVEVAEVEEFFSTPPTTAAAEVAAVRSRT